VRSQAVRSRLAALALAAAFAAALASRLRMGEGIVLSNAVKSRFAPWAASQAGRPLEAPALSDPVLQLAPWLSLAHRELAAGRLPLWNPHQDGGVPLLGNAQSALGSPLVWPALLFGLRPGWNLSLLLRAALAAAAAWLWLRDRGRSPEAAALGAAAFALSGPFVAWLEHPHTLAAAGVPLLLLFGGRLAARPRRRDALGLVLATYLVLAGGHPETALMAFFLAAAYACVRAGGVAPLRVSSAAGLGALLASPLLLPFAEYFALSEARTGAARHPFVLTARALARFVVPDAAGSHPIEAAAAVSLAVLALLPFGLARARRDRERLFWAGAAVLLLFLAYGGSPALAIARASDLYLTRGLLLLPLALGFLAAAGLDDLVARARTAGRERPARLCAAALAAAAALELLAFAGGVHAVAPERDLTPETPVLARLRARAGDDRILPLHTFLPANTATDLALDDLRGYDALAPRAFRRARAAIGRFTNLPNAVDVLEPWDLAPGGRALDEWSVRWLLLDTRFPFGADELSRRFGLELREVLASADGRILENLRAKPRARLEGAEGDAWILERSASRWRVAVDARTAGALVVANAAFPGWRARVDGAPAAILSAVGTPLSVPVPAGRHEVVLAYAPASFRIGLALAAAALLLIPLLLRRLPS
jgi:hypothetical protein